MKIPPSLRPSNTHLSLIFSLSQIRVALFSLTLPVCCTANIIHCVSAFSHLAFALLHRTLTLILTHDDYLSSV